MKRPYIATTIIGASLCAVILSMSLPKEQPKEPIQNQVQEQTETSLQATPKKEETELPVKKETELPNTTASEIKQNEKPQTAEVPKEVPSQPTAETVSAGSFGQKELILQKPAEGEIIVPFSQDKPLKSKTMNDWRVHCGIDIRAEQGQALTCPADGKVTAAKNDGLTGYTVSIDHGNGVVSTLYGLESVEGITKGQEVKQGEEIVKAGNSAKVEMLEDPHVHYEVTVNGEFVNPEAYFKK